MAMNSGWDEDVLSIVSAGEHGGAGHTPFSTPKRPSRLVKPMSKVRDTARQLEDTA